MNKQISIKPFERTKDKDWCKGHIYKDNNDTKILINKKDLEVWLKTNWEQRYTQPINLKLPGETKSTEYLIRRLQFKPGITSSLQYSLIYIELMNTDKVLNSKKIKVSIYVNYRNTSKLKFGVFTIILRYLTIKLRTLKMKMFDINVPSYLSLNRRTLRINDLDLKDDFQIIQKGNLPICKVLLSSKERRNLHTQWIKKKQSDPTTS